MARTSPLAELDARCRAFADELANLIKRSVATAVEDALRVREPKLPDRSRLASYVVPRRVQRSAPSVQSGEPRTFADYERLALEHAMAKTAGSRKAAAKLLGMSKSAMSRAFQRAGIRAGWKPLHPAPAASIDGPVSLEMYERKAIASALDHTRGNTAAAAKRLGVGRSTLYRRMLACGIATPRAGARRA